MRCMTAIGPGSELELRAKCTHVETLAAFRQAKRDLRKQADQMRSIVDGCHKLPHRRAEVE